MAKTYWVQFGAGNPQVFTGLTPTFIIFIQQNGVNATPPSISEVGASIGLYIFSYEPSQTLAIGFTVDAGSAVSGTDRYVTGVLDAVSAVDERVGHINDSFGTTAIDPSTIWGMVKRLQELLEGDGSFAKATGVWQISSRGSSTLLREKDLTNSITSATKTGL